MKWYVLRYDFNSKKVVNYNIFGKETKAELKKARRNKKFNNQEELKEYLRKDFQYHYWSKAECEMAVGDLFCKPETMEKIDIYRQIEPNLDRITEYVIKECGFRF